jgi:hypothetical protein
MSDMTFDAHSAFIAPTRGKRLRVGHKCILIDYEVILAMPERKETKEEGGGGEGIAFNYFCNPTQDAEWCLV